MRGQDDKNDGAVQEAVRSYCVGTVCKRSGMLKQLLQKGTIQEAHRSAKEFIQSLLDLSAFSYVSDSAKKVIMNEI
jgi:hypothetical protein